MSGPVTTGGQVPEVTVPAVDALTADGAIVTLRPAAPSDRDALTDLFRRSSGASLRLRFFANPGRPLLEAEVARAVRPSGPDHATIVAELAGDLVGVASFERPRPEAAKAEFAVFVEDAHQGRGIGTLLIEHLARHAHQVGVTHLYGEVLAANARMLRVAGDLSAAARSRLADGLVEVRVATAVDDSTLARVDARDRVAERASLRPLLAPAAVAVVGDLRHAGGAGHEVVSALVEYGFTGQVYPVDPGVAEVAGVPAYPTLRRLPGPVDLVVVAVPADQVASVLADAATAGARAAVILAPGFTPGVGRAGPADAAARTALLRQARAHGIRLVGPDSLGVINTDPAVRLDASLTPEPPRPGGLAVASQSGAVGTAILDHAFRGGCGISTFISLGDKVDVSGNDLIAYWYDDPATTAVALYLESFGNPRKFARIARALARRKPVLAVFSGASTAGRRRAAAADSAATASGGAATVTGDGDVAARDPAAARGTRAGVSRATVDALFAQAGVVRAADLGELIDAARILTDQPLPRGDRLAVVGNAGGVNLLVADAADAHGLRLPDRVAGLDNPLDLGSEATDREFTHALSAVAASGEVDAVLAVIAANRANDPATLAGAVGAVADRHPELPVAAVVLGAATSAAVGARRVPVYDLPERAVRALGHAAAYAAWRREPLGSRPALPDVDATAARAVVRSALAEGGGWQPPDRVARILSCYGVRLAPPTEREAARPAAADVVELVAGVAHDPLFGSLVMVGLGGVHGELLGDRAFRLVPMTDLDARRMWRSLRGAALLTGHDDAGAGGAGAGDAGVGGAAPVDTAALEDLLLRLGRLAEDLPEAAALDLSPVLAGPTGVTVVDARLRLAPAGDEPDPALRRLR